MRDEIKIIFFVSIIILGLSFFISSGIQTTSTGLVIGNLSLTEGVLNNTGGILNKSAVIFANTTEQEAQAGIAEAEAIMNELIQNNFSVFYVNDSIIEAKRVFKQAKYVNVLRNESESKAKKSEAAAVLQLVEWKNISYDSVMIFVKDVRERKHKAFIIFDSITALKISIQGYEGRGVNVSAANSILEKAETAFYEDQYENAETLLNSVRDELKLQAFSFSVLSAVRKGIQTFIEKYWNKYWYIIVIGFATASIAAFFTYRKISELMLREEINRLKIEKESLFTLMKKTQEDRFKNNSISGMAYNTRMQKYKEKLADVERKKSLLEDKLNKLLIPAGYLIGSQQIYK